VWWGRSRGDARPGVGYEVDLIVALFNLPSPMRFVMTEFSAEERRFRCRGTSPAATVEDEFVVLDAGEGRTRVEYSGRIALRGPLKALHPLLRPAFEQVGRDMGDGLEAHFGPPVQTLNG